MSQATSFSGTSTSAYRSASNSCIRIPEFVRTVTPTQASPASPSTGPIIRQMMSASAPPDVLNGSTRTRPLNPAGSLGARTMTRVT